MASPAKSESPKAPDVVSAIARLIRRGDVSRLMRTGDAWVEKIDNNELVVRINGTRLKLTVT